MALYQTLDAFHDKELDFDKFQSCLSDEQQKMEQLKKEVESLKSLVQDIEHGGTGVKPLLEQPASPLKGNRQPSEPLAQHSEEDEGVAVPSGPKDDPRPRKASHLNSKRRLKGSNLSFKTSNKVGQVRAKQEKDALVIQVTQEKDALSTQAQRTIDALQVSFVQVEGIKSALQDQVSGLESSVTLLEEEGHKLRESLALREEHICFLEDKKRNLSNQIEL
ncbi:hypothetical protein CJ030_MR3G015071 [Morella rubra]|uniref:Uncharacterized protein n=1 Tax=Morella rubra TaxID=262757 RepID=A0A6A1W2A5_9ROSI|nr:hypothetical protein CJ030_MR3G015071 [Morella rubra]